jgi:5-methylcytosine-specific restriction endonuclease McrA
MAKPQYDYQWQKMRKRILHASDICWLCGHPGANSVDHVVPLSKGGARLDPANLRPAHMICNSRRGNKQVGPVMRTSRRW